MVQLKGKRRSVIIVGAIVTLLLVVGAVVLVNALNSGKDDPYKQVETTNTPSDTSSDNTDTPDSTSTPNTDDGDTKDTPTLDPATLSTLSIEPMKLTVSYVKVNAGFEYYVLRTANGTQYVEFSSPELVGTKCTNDKGVFASIIEAPSTSEAATISKTVTVDSTKYGLSLADATCTKDAELLKQLQASFSDAFGLLKRTNS